MPDLKEIKHLRTKLGISQEKLGELINSNQSTISRIESGDADPPYSKVKILFEYLKNEKMKRKKGAKKAETIMTRDIISISSKATLKEAVNLMNHYNISQLPIIDDNVNLGSITAKSIQKIITDTPDLINAEINLVKELPFPEIKKDWAIKDISNMLLNYSAVLVKELGKYVGIITDADLLKIE